MDSLFVIYAGQVAPIAYHTWWPGTDNFYQANPLDVQNRVAYYDVGYVPSFRFDGHYIEDPSTVGDWYGFFSATVESLFAVPSPVRINLDQLLSQDGDSVYVSFDVVAVDSIAYTLRTIGVAAFVAVTE